MRVDARARSEPEERRDTRFLAVIGFPHAKDVAIRATRCVAYDDDATVENAEADDSDFAVVSAGVLDRKRRTCEDNLCVIEVESAVLKSGRSLGRVVRD